MDAETADQLAVVIQLVEVALELGDDDPMPWEDSVDEASGQDEHAVPDPAVEKLLAEAHVSSRAATARQLDLDAIHAAIIRGDGSRPSSG